MAQYANKVLVGVLRLPNHTPAEASARQFHSIEEKGIIKYSTITFISTIQRIGTFSILCIFRVCGGKQDFQCVSMFIWIFNRCQH